MKPRSVKSITRTVLFELFVAALFLITVPIGCILIATGEYPTYELPASNLPTK